MHRRLASILLALAWLAAPMLAAASHLPAPKGYVNDFAGLIGADQATELDRQLTDFDHKTGAQIAVVTVADLGGDSIDDFASHAFEEWKIGQKGKDNGVLLLVAKAERQVRIEVGYGLEPSITDAQAGDIIRTDITPQFKQGHYYEGIKSGLAAIEQRISSDAANINPVPAPRPSPHLGDWLIFGLFLLGPLLSYLGSFLARSKSWWLGGVLGAGAGLGLGQALHGLAFSLITAGVLGGFGLLLDFILSHNYHERRTRGFNTGFWGSGGGFFGGGSGGGGGSFGGFGGGSSGGGGASGGW